MESIGGYLITILFLLAMVCGTGCGQPAKQEERSSTLRAGDWGDLLDEECAASEESVEILQTPSLASKALDTLGIEPKALQLSKEDLLEAIDENLVAVRFAMNQRYPQIQGDEDVEFRLKNGIVVRGNLMEIGPEELVLLANGVTNRIPVRDLDVNERRRADFAFRDEWIEACAAARTRGDYLKDGFVLPTLSWTDETELAEAVNLGDPEAALVLAKRYGSKKSALYDPGYAYIYYYLAASQDSAEAEFLLGCMTYHGIAIPRDWHRALALIAASAGQDWSPAKRFLAQHKVSEQKWREAATAYAEKKEKERLAHSASLEEARRNPKYTIIAKTRGLRGVIGRRSSAPQSSRVTMGPGGYQTITTGNSGKRSWYEWNGNTWVKHTRIGRR